jgi:chromate transporter
MPGANVTNLAIMVGQRLRGLPGALAAVLGMLMGPSLVVIAAAALYREFAGTLMVRAVLDGTALTAVGLLVGMGGQSLARVLRTSARSGRNAAWVGCALTVVVSIVVLVGVLRFPTAATVLCLAPVSVALAFYRRGPADGGGG